MFHAATNLQRIAHLELSGHPVGEYQILGNWYAHKSFTYNNLQPYC